ncbi:hypothetical protein B0H17DRAFT_1214620 [Mycena rosella]|uniref:Uncharacterized protein n=1 Tax=Mycena rosella TaxID=1033263 RepID=A0AAD7G3W1_MYCRO|nr:hypothetical protein B0H17DRAFT_1214620 [Mycena rosella]
MGPNATTSKHAMAGGTGSDDSDRGCKHKHPSSAERSAAKREKAKRAKRNAKGKGKATREDEEEDEEEKALPGSRIRTRDALMPPRALEEIRAIDQEAAEEEFEEMEVRHGVSPSVDPRESDEVNDETDSDKEFAGKKMRGLHKEKRDLRCLKVNEAQVLGLYLVP